MSLLASRYFPRGYSTWASRVKYCGLGRYPRLSRPIRWYSRYGPYLRPLAASSSSQNGDSPPSPSRVERDARNQEILLRLVSCHGCGAAVQTADPELPGYFSMSRRAVLSYMQASPLELYTRQSATEAPSTIAERSDHGESGPETALENIPEQRDLVQPHTGSKDTGMAVESPALAQSVHRPLCDRCHQLTHHNIGSYIAFPSVQAVTDSILESPYHNNHVYHVIDAVDFPLSVLPDIHRLVPAMSQRSRNRRAKHERFQHGRKVDLTFVITRSDLLAPKKEMVDSMMPYFAETLRQALHPSLRNVRLGNVRCVSSKRGWWTKVLKDDIHDRAGACWLVGKVNVGKSSLFEAVFPKGNQVVEPNSEPRYEASDAEPQYESRTPGGQDLPHETTTVSTASHLLPPARPETQYPEMPIVSSFPGTTASPIRIPFGNGRGELIDLPGLPRSNLDKFVKPEHRDELIMKTRVQPKQYVVKPGQSLLLGGLFRITATDPNVTMLAYPFVPLEAHVTSTEKASNFLSAAEHRNIPSIATADVGGAIERAGAFPLQWDVTQQRAGPLLSRTAAKLKAHSLPFKVMSADIIIEGCGWVELVAQVRRRGSAEQTDSGIDLEEYSDFTEADSGTAPRAEHPLVEVFSPVGRYVGLRRPLGAWLLNGKPSTPLSQQRTRPRRSMRSMKGSPKRHADILNQPKVVPS